MDPWRSTDYAIFGWPLRMTTTTTITTTVTGRLAVNTTPTNPVRYLLTESRPRMSAANPHGLTRPIPSPRTIRSPPHVRFPLAANSTMSQVNSGSPGQMFAYPEKKSWIGQSSGYFANWEGLLSAGYVRTGVQVVFEILWNRLIDTRTVLTTPAGMSGDLGSE